MIFELTKYELQFLLDQRQWLDDSAKFFTNGGFNKYDDDHLNRQYVLKIQEEEV